MTKPRKKPAAKKAKKPTPRKDQSQWDVSDLIALLD
jgi:hypothetical protein